MTIHHLRLMRLVRIGRYGSGPGNVAFAVDIVQQPPELPASRVGGLVDLSGPPLIQQAVRGPGPGRVGAQRGAGGGEDAVELRLGLGGFALLL
ncbi:hypothetical protein, partial [Nocardia brasiliensis]|uniref:hypothetical protein n=1 Tax=Nocardia brasiliensis TaxID=37326 RepID=UPI0024554427